MDSLATVVESMTRANKALREAIERSADEVGQLEKFEDHFETTRDRFLHFKQAALSNNQQADELLVRLEQSLQEKRRTAEDIKREIAGLRQERKEQDEENQRLEKALDYNVINLKPINMATNMANTYANSPTPMKNKPFTHSHKEAPFNFKSSLLQASD